MTRELNRVFNRNDLVDKADAPQCTVTIEQAECEVSKSHFGSEVSKSHFEHVCRQAPKKTVFLTGVNFIARHGLWMSLRGDMRLPRDCFKRVCMPHAPC